MRHPDYWKVKAAVLTAQKARVDAELLVARADAQLGVVMHRAGLDPQYSYQFGDDDESITLQDPDVPPPA